MGCNRALCISALFAICNLLYPFDAFLISDSENQSLLSSDGNFKLGFFSSGKSRARYVGIWLNKIPQQTVVWVANRATPIKNSRGVFKIAQDGNLAIFCGNETTPLWSTNVSMSTATTSSSTSSAKLLDSGNLILVVQESIVWQSFDYPTDTLVSGMKFGLNKKTGFTHVLTSWKSIDDPSPGEFSVRLDPQGVPQFFFYKGSEPYWRAGPWNGRNLNGVPDVATRFKGKKVTHSGQIGLLNYTFVDNENESYHIFSPKNGPLFCIVVLEPMGSMKRIIWDESRGWATFWMAPQDTCDAYNRCGANEICNDESVVHCACLPGFQPSYPQDLYLKCIKTGKINGCGRGQGEGFVKLEAVKLPDTRNSTLYPNMTLKECERECLKSCNCTGYATLDVISGARRCITWYGELKDMRHYQDGQDFYLRVDAVELAADARKKSEEFLAAEGPLVFIILPVVVELLLAVMCFYYLWRRQVMRKGQEQKKHLHQRLLWDSARSLSDYKDSSSSNDQSGNIDLTFFELNTVTAATNHFSTANKLGRGGFGPVYKGRLLNGQEVAVKRLSNDSEQGIVEFKNEVLVIAKLQHRNLVRLLGYCMEKEEKILIYEFMPNKSLDCFIFDDSRRLLLDWKTRFNIILGIARGILYLHQDSRLRIIHRDLKVSNILLDKDMKPKISDFGTARIFGGDETQANTKRVIGTYGYMSPEYALDGIFSIKSDVFSFGVIILEIISGKKNRGVFYDDPYSNLIQYTWELWKDGKTLKIVDPCLADSCSSNEVLRSIQIGLLCVQDKATDRPSMSSVVFMLSNEATIPTPMKSSFVIKNGQHSSLGRECSTNKLTITTFNGR